MVWAVLVLYATAMGLVTIFSLGQLNLAFHYRKSRNHPPQKISESNLLPLTIQLPVYNEKYVVKRLIESVVQLDYPAHKLEIQVLDDSTDETSSIIAESIAEMAHLGKRIHHIRREERVGFKAGALQHGLTLAKGDLIAIFDADFVPEKDFLLKAVPYFVNEKTGMVQTRWAHLNQDYNLLTKMQAFGLDAHFTVEQGGRQFSNSFINFNGTAGIWRKSCIVDAGGWQHDTLTEDLDLSYRAQLNGWDFKYVESISCPAELPIIVPAIKSQQYRWNKGAAETARKNLWKVLKSPFSVATKVRAIFHLLNSSVFLYLLLASMLSIPLLYFKDANPSLSLAFNLGSIFIVGFIAIAAFYWAASKASKPKQTFRYFIVYFPLFLIFSMGLSLHNAIAIIEGLLGKKTPFVRTPKFNMSGKGIGWKDNSYIKKAFNPAILLEGIFGLYFLFGVAFGIYLKDYGLLPFHLMLATGFFGVFFYSAFYHRYVS